MSDEHFESEITDEQFVEQLTDYLESNYLEQILGLLPSATYMQSLESADMLDFFLKRPDDFIKLLREAIIGIIAENNAGYSREKVENEYKNLNIVLSSETNQKLSDIKSELINSPIVFRCVMTGLNPREAYIERAAFRCPKGHEQGQMNVSCNNKRELPTIACPDCNEKLEVVPDKSIYKYLQRATIQEPPEESKKGNPLEFDAVLTDLQVGAATVGDRKEIIGIFRPMVDKKALLENKIKLMIDIKSVNDLEGHEELTLDDTEVEKFTELAQSRAWLTNLAKSFSPEVFADDLLLDVKKTLLLSLVGGERVNNKRGDINILMLGDPSMAKSTLLKFADKVVRKSMYTSGKGASTAGITIGIVKRHDGTSIAQAGILPLCNDGFAFIDELDKMNPTDRSGLHEAMEQQCYDDKTEILTENGWKYFKDLNKNERVASLNKNGKLIYSKPTMYVDTKYNGVMYDVQSRQVNLSVTPNHNMYVNINKRANKWNGFGLIRMCDLPQKRMRFKKNAMWKGIERKTFAIPSISKKVNQHKQYNTKTIKVNMNDWLEFLGYYITEGSTQKSKGVPYATIITQIKSKTRTRIISCIKRLGFEPKINGDNIVVYSKQLATYMAQFGYSYNKFIPRNVFDLSPKQLQILFDALILGDGYLTKNTNHKGFVTSSKQLRDDFQELCLKLGMSSNDYIRHIAGETVNLPEGRTGKVSHDIHELSVIPNKSCEPNINHSGYNHITKRKYNGRIYCVEVPNHTLYVRRNGKPVWCGNTVSISKAGFSMTLPAKTTIIAAANPKGGKWQHEAPVVDNINLMPTLLSRFDIKWCIRDIVARGSDELKADHILNAYANDIESEFSVELIQKILNYVRHLHPVMTKEARDHLKEFFTTIRQKSIEEEQAIIDLRQLEGLVRLSYAHAKLYFKKEVTVEDVNAVISLYERSLASFGFNLASGDVKQQTFEQNSKENQIELWWKVWRIVQDDETKTVDDREFFEEILKYDKIWTETKAEQFWNKLHKEGKILMTRDGWRRS